MKILTIVRSQWYRGHRFGSYLLRAADGKMCCLGFDAIACGLDKEMIEQIGNPYEVVVDWHDALPPEYLSSTRFDRVDNYNGETTQAQIINEAIQINDDEHISDEEREAKLIPLLKRIGGYDDVVFVD